MRIFLDQIGCRLNYSEMESLARALRAAGHETVSSAEQAQVVVFNTCAVTRDGGPQEPTAYTATAPGEPSGANCRDGVLVDAVAGEGAFVARRGAGSREYREGVAACPAGAVECRAGRCGDVAAHAAGRHAVCGRVSGRASEPDTGVRQGAGRVQQPLHVLCGDAGAGRESQPDVGGDRGRGAGAGGTRACRRRC